MLTTKIYAVLIDEEKKHLSASFELDKEALATTLGSNDEQFIGIYHHCIQETLFRGKTITEHRIWLLEALDSWSEETGISYHKTKATDLLHELCEHLIKESK